MDEELPYPGLTNISVILTVLGQIRVKVTLRTILHDNVQRQSIDERIKVLHNVRRRDLTLNEYLVNGIDCAVVEASLNASVNTLDDVKLLIDCYQMAYSWTSLSTPHRKCLIPAWSAL